MASYLTASVQATIKKALDRLPDTFFTYTVTLNKRTTVLDSYGEGPVVTRTTQTFRCLPESSVGKSGRYENIDKSPMGQREQFSWLIYVWHQDMLDWGGLVDAEADSVTFDGIEYEIRKFGPVALFADLGWTMDAFELKVVSGAIGPGTQ